jgi:hypothetical protein
MGFLDDDEDSGTTRVDLKPGYWVEVMNCLPHSKAEQAEALLSSSTIHKSAEGTHATNTAAYRTYMVVASVVAWNLDDGAGEQTRIWDFSTDKAKSDGIGRLPERYFQKLWDAVNDLNGKRSKAEQARFPDGGDAGDPPGDAGTAVADEAGAGAVALAGTRDEPAGLPVSAVA